MVAYTAAATQFKQERLPYLSIATGSLALACSSRRLQAEIRHLWPSRAASEQS